jgi:hypothetical protein
MARPYYKSRTTSGRGQSIRINEILHAKTVLAAQEAGQSLGAWAEAALQAALERHEEDRKRRAYQQAKEAAARTGQPSPLASDYRQPRRS